MNQTDANVMPPHDWSETDLWWRVPAPSRDVVGPGSAPLRDVVEGLLRGGGEGGGCTAPVPIPWPWPEEGASVEVSLRYRYQREQINLPFGYLRSVWTAEQIGCLDPRRQLPIASTNDSGEEYVLTTTCGIVDDLPEQAIDDIRALASKVGNGEVLAWDVGAQVWMRHPATGELFPLCSLGPLDDEDVAPDFERRCILHSDMDVEEAVDELWRKILDPLLAAARDRLLAAAPLVDRALRRARRARARA